MTSVNPIIKNALNAARRQDSQVLIELAALLKEKPWEDPKYIARVAAEQENQMRSRYGNRKVDEWIRIMKKNGWWKG